MVKNRLDGIAGIALKQNSTLEKLTFAESGESKNNF